MKIVHSSEMKTSAKHSLHVAKITKLTTFALLSYLSHQSAMASTIVSTSASAGGTHMIQMPLDYVQDSGAHGEIAQATSNVANDGTVYSGAAPYPAVGTQYASANASAFASEGVLRATVSAGAETTGIVYNAASADSTATARWSDYLTVDAGSQFLNQSGFITAQMNVSGTFAGSPGDYGEVRLGVRLSGTGMARDNANCGGWAYCITQRSSAGAYFNGPQVAINTFPGTVTLMIPVYFGHAVTLDYGIDLYASAQALTFANGNPTGAGAEADFSHTFSWGGITGVYDAQGNALDSFSVNSASGFDYLHSAAVPVPAAAWLFGSGLLGLAGVARRKSKTIH